MISKKLFDSRWKAELIEQIMRFRLKRWVVDGRHEWVQLSYIHVVDCMNNTILEIENEFEKHKYIHKQKKRKEYYKQIAEIYFE